MSEKMRVAARQALKALEKLVVGAEYEEAIEAEQAIAALRAALAEPKPVQEPVAWASKRDLARIKEWDAVAYASGGFDDAVPLYTAPPQREPLTNEEINVLFSEALKGDKSAHWLCRAIERAVRGEKE